MIENGLCHQPVIQQGGLLFSLFIAGLTGGFTHCAGMCGPFVLSISPTAHAHLWRRLTGMALLPYHLGRVTTYAGLGFLGAMFAGHAKEVLQFGWLPSALLAVGGTLFLAQFLGFNLKLNLPSLPRAMERQVLALSSQYNAGRGYLLGVLLGFLPCGFLLSALLVAASATSPLQGALAMLVFGLATAPALNLTYLARELILLHRPNFMPHLRRGLSLASAVTLFVLAGVRLI